MPTDPELMPDEELRKRQLQQTEAVGTPIQPAVSSSPVLSDTNAPAPPAPTASEAVGQPMQPPNPPRPIPSPTQIPIVPEQPTDTAQAMKSIQSVGTPIAQPPAPLTPRPQYHGLNRLLDTLAGTTQIGSDIERAGRFGTQGWEATSEDERRQIEDEQKAEQSRAAVEKSGAEAAKDQATADATSQNVTITDPVTGHVLSVSAKDAPGIWKEIIGQTGAGQRTDATNTTRESIAGSNNESRESIAGGNNTSRENIASGRDATNKAIAEGRNLTSKEVATIRASAAGDPNKLTAVMRTMKQQAQATLPEIDKALDETEKVAQKLGPIAGRWSDFWQGKVGASDPEFTHYKDEIGMVSTAVTLAHARGRMSNELFEHFQNMFDAGKQSPENLIAALNVAHEWLSGYAKMGDVPDTQSSKGDATQTSSGGNRGVEAGKSGSPSTPKVQQNSKGEFRYSIDGGNTWHPGKPQQ